MKKFLVYLVTILFAVGIAFTVYYLVRDNEVISLSTTKVYTEVGKPCDVEIIYNNRKLLSDYDTKSTNKNVAYYDKDKKQIIPVSGGYAIITFSTTNYKYRNLICEVYVGDGGKLYPFYVSSAEQLQQIGKVTEVNGVKSCKYGLDKSYKLTNSIDLKNVNWLPIGYGNEDKKFTGRFNGNGFTISNVKIDIDSYNKGVDEAFKCGTENIGFFAEIGHHGMVYNTNFKNVSITQEVKAASNIGVVAGTNNGNIERINVTKDKPENNYFNITVPEGVTFEENTFNIGGIVGVNKSNEINVNANGSTEDYRRFLARIDRCNYSGTIGAKFDVVNNPDGSTKGVLKPVSISKANIGGIAGLNLGARIVYSSCKDSAINIGSNANVGGITGYNKFLNCDKTSGVDSKYEYPCIGAHVKETLTSVKFNLADGATANNIGAVIGKFSDYIEEKVNLTDKVTGFDRYNPFSIVSGNYYDSTVAGTAVTTGVGSYYAKDYKKQSAEDDNKGVYTEFKDDDNNNENGYRNYYHVKGYTTEQLINGENKNLIYVTDKKAKLDQDNKEIKGEFELVNWKFGSVWEMEDGKYPYLSYDEVAVSDDITFVTSKLTKVEDLIAIKPDGHYEITTDLDFDKAGIKTWTPIGTLQEPFVGSLIGVGDVRIKNLPFNRAAVLKLEDLEYFGLFGAVSSPAIIKNITIDKIHNYEENDQMAVDVAGGIAAFNGYDNKIMDINVENAYIGGTIENCVAEGLVLDAKKALGGIVGFNAGKIVNCQTTLSEVISGDADASETITNLTLNVCDDIFTTSSVGGVVGLNIGEINGSKAISDTTINIEKLDSVVGQNIYGYAGGIVGNNHNYGSADKSANIVNCAVENVQVLASDKILARLGGIAGASSRPIEGAKVINSTIISSKKNPEINVDTLGRQEFTIDYNSYALAGGIVGELNELGKLYKCLVSVNSGSTVVEAELSAGLAAVVNYNNMAAGTSVKLFDEKGNDITTIANKKRIARIELSNENTEIESLYTISNCAVNSVNVLVKGKLSAGLVTYVQNGYIRDCLTKAALDSFDSSGKYVNAGLVVIMYNNYKYENGGATCTSLSSIEKCFTNCKFNQNNHKNRYIIKTPFTDSGLLDGTGMNGYQKQYMVVNSIYYNKGTENLNDDGINKKFAIGFDDKTIGDQGIYGALDKTNVWEITSNGPELRFINEVK